MRGRLVQLAAAMLLVALGIGLGAGPLQHGAQERDRDLAAARKAAAQGDARINALERVVALGDGYAAATASTVLGGALSDRRVAILALPGAEPRTVQDLAGVVQGAGATVSARLALEPAALDSSGAGLLDALTSQMLTQAGGLGVPSTANAYERLGVLLSRAIGLPASARAFAGPRDDVAISIASGLQAAGLAGEPTVTERAGLTLVVLPASSAKGTYDAAAAVLSAYGRQVPTVVTGPAAAAGPEGLLAALRAADLPASTVDSVDSPTGRIVALLTLAARTRGVIDDFGTVGTVKGPVPPLS